MHGYGESPVDGVDVEQLIGWILSVAPSYRWGGRQGIDRIRPGLEARALVGTYELALGDPGARIFVERSGDEPVAATVLTPKPMETECFELVTAALSHVVCAQDVEDRPDVVRRMLDRVRTAAADEGIELLILRVDADDVETLWAAQSAGFTVCEATTTWLADSHADAAPVEQPPGLVVETYEGEVSDALTPEEVSTLAAATSRWELNHFRADPLLPRTAVDRFYERWIHNIASGAWSDCLFVARYDGRVVGVESEYTDRQLLDLTGTDVRAGEWIVVLEHGLGAGRALMSAAGRHRHPGGRFHSWETQVRNTATIRCIEQSGVARPIRSAYTLHAWPTR